LSPADAGNVPEEMYAVSVATQLTSSLKFTATAYYFVCVLLSLTENSKPNINKKLRSILIFPF